MDTSVGSLEGHKLHTETDDCCEVTPWVTKNV